MIWVFLSPEHSLKLFMQHAFKGRDLNLYQDLVAIGKEIARKCGGVPLAAKTLGGLLRTKDDEEWNEILKSSEVWNTTINQEDSVIPILRLSYLHLPAPLKRCFKYCSLFPKDDVFDRNQIIHMWMAQGYIKAKRREQMEDIGQRYIDNLLLRSFFQKYPWNSKSLQMHDLMHDLARCVSGNECYSMEGYKSCSIPKHVRHFSIFPTSDSHETIILSRSNISEPKSLRSFIMPGKDFWYSISGQEIDSLSYTRMEHLRVLDLGGARLDHLPESIARLKHLRFFRISSVKALPQSVGSLYHLQTLDLGRVSELPNSISNLHNLRHLILSSRDCVRYLVGIGNLTNLQTMPGFFVSPNHNCAKLGELKDMNNIRGEFAISGLENLANVSEAKKAYLDTKRNISSLCLEWNHLAASSSIDEEVLESLKPSVKLASLEISGFKGPSFPSWLADLSFSRLGIVKLERCENWVSLPPLGQLPSLKSLYVSKARAVEYIGRGFFSGGFPQLEELTLREMGNLKSWCGAQEGECPKLKKLSIDRCPNLESLSLINLGAVVDMYVSIFMSPLELSYLQRAKRIKINKMINHGWSIEAHISPAALSEDEPHLQVEDVGQREAEHILAMCSHICGLTMKKCLNLTCLPLGNQSAMKYVEICDCSYLRITSISPQLWQLPSLRRIHVYGIHGAVSIKIVRESYMELTNVDQLVASALLKEFSHMIRRLIITGNKTLTSLPWTDLTILEYLRISECPLFQLLDAEQLPSTLQVMCIYGNPYEAEQCRQHQHFQRLKQVQQCSNKEGGERNLYLVFRNVRDACEASEFCSMDFTEIHTLDIEWDCCTNVGYINVTDAIMQKVLLYLYSFRILGKKLVIRGYTGSHLAPLCRLPNLQELYVEGASSLETVALTSDFPDLWKLVLKHCPKLRALPPLPPRLEELILEGCEELQSLSFSCQGLKSLNSLSRLSVTNCPNLDFTATKGPPPRLELMSLTGCPLLLAWCEGHPRMLASLSYLCVDGVQVSIRKFTSLE